eukprot:CAMPEP_0201521382 /NCGR_PEP_ID=MMETSP0161_2-20130828/14388_1 /ASSEMBLY_ACC=CAM_ASM_000251 /TAXON_ID=180227 /ORGANISM="Neoparamoeba aestuarina, Strain SoJaBio B1-5/56/2" /LENGTH=270 /DNA_ID=CAMNT_0047920013 /DNA_START=111 /DNA_END=923 /DNA_ORIENTATION=+
MSSFSELVKKFETFKQLFEQKEYEKCQEILPAFKIAMMQLSLSHMNTDAPFPADKVDEFILCRNALEMATLLSIRTKDMVAFERNFAQLRHHYQPREGIPSSEMDYSILGLFLIHLLAAHRHSEFLTELELIPTEKHQTNHHIQSAIQLENWLVSGSYSRVFAYRKTVPDDNIYCYPLDLLLILTRKEMAACLTSAYKELPLEVVKQKMNFSSSEELVAFVNDMKPKWAIDEAQKIVKFASESDNDKKEIPTMKLIGRSLQYAKELERIV